MSKTNIPVNKHKVIFYTCVLIALLLTGFNHTFAQPDTVSITVNVLKVIGPMKPFWAYFGYDEPNYTYMNNGKKLLTEISGLSPVIKRICTTSFIFISAGWTILCFAFCYWIADIKKNTRWAYVFILFGMNPIFIYMLSNTLGYQWLNGFLLIFTKGIFQVLHFSIIYIKIINSLFILVLESLLLYYMFKKSIFIKI